MRALSRCDPADIARVAAVSLLFHASLALEAIRLWAQGFELPAQPAAQPEGEGAAPCGGCASLQWSQLCKPLMATFYIHRVPCPRVSVNFVCPSVPSREECAFVDCARAQLSFKSRLKRTSYVAQYN